MSRQVEQVWSRRRTGRWPVLIRGSGAFDGLLRFPVNHSARCLSAAFPPLSNAAGSQKGRLREQKATEEEEKKNS